MDLIKLLEDKNAFKLAKLLTDAGFEAYYVGGCVRDALFGVEPKDIDICTDSLPDQILELLHKNHIHSMEVGAKFGTIVAILDDIQYEITTYRSDGEYADNRKPQSVEFVSTINQDLSRRDFTMNAIAFDPFCDKDDLTSGLVDPFNGQFDMSLKELKCVGSADKRFKEDGLRILRALRFAIKYELEIESQTAKAIHENKDLLSNISKERITAELEKMLTCGKPIKDIFIEFNDVISVIIPEIECCIGFEQNNKYHKHNVYEHLLSVVDACETTDFNTKFAALLHDIGKPKSYTEDEEGHGHFYGHSIDSEEISKEVLLSDFRLSNDDYHQILRLVKSHDMQPVNTDRSCRKLIINVGQDAIEKWFVLKNADISDHITIGNYYKDLPLIHERVNKLIETENCFKVKDLEVSGKDVMDVLQIKPGKQVGYVLDVLFEKVVDGALLNERKELLKAISEITSE